MKVGDIIIRDFSIQNYQTQHPDLNEDIWRIIENFGQSFKIVNQAGIIVTAHLKNNYDTHCIVGDYITVSSEHDTYYIQSVLPRTSVISKAVATTSKSYHLSTDEQLLAANIDQIFIFIAADQRFSLGKLERYLLVFGSMAAQVTIVISKSDFSEASSQIFYEIIATYPEMNVIKLSLNQPETIHTIKQYFIKNGTAILIGASGAGKSSFINHLNGHELSKTNAVRSDGKGKHTTTNSKIYYNESTESYIMDAPGFKNIATHREIDTDILFAPINELAQHCKFSNCKHQTEPHCAVKQAIKNGELSQELLDRYFYTEQKMLKYERYLKLKNCSKK